MSEAASPNYRASDEDRNRIAQALNESFSRGQLTFAELDERTAQVWAATFRAELLASLSDLMPDPARVLDEQLPAHISPAPARKAGAETAQQQVTGGPGGQGFSFAMVGVSQKRGQWLCARNHVSLALVGATTLDLRRAHFASHETTIWAFGIVGAVELLVPEDVLVIGDGIGIVGAFDVTKDDKVSIAQRDLPADAPVVRVRGLGLVGAVTVRRVPRESSD